jgi:hypothetical protein
MKQLPHLAWVEDKISVFKFQKQELQQEHEQQEYFFVSKLQQQEQEQQKSPQYLNIPDDLSPYMNMSSALQVEQIIGGSFPSSYGSIFYSENHL